MFIIKNGVLKSFLEGYFYNNLLNGYGRLIHTDGLQHEGNFKNNKRFGNGTTIGTDNTRVYC